MAEPGRAPGALRGPSRGIARGGRGRCCRGSLAATTATTLAGRLTARALIEGRGTARSGRRRRRANRLFKGRDVVAEGTRRNGRRRRRRRTRRGRDLLARPVSRARDALAGHAERRAIEEVRRRVAARRDCNREDAAADAHAGERRRDLHFGFLADDAAHEAQGSARHVERHLARLRVGVVDELVDHHVAVRPDGE
jgi:hypothetical protein